MKGLISVEKIKINLVSGSSLEKPLVSAFKSNNAIYVVFDNEINGTMGLPIILVSKLENNKLTKIVDQNEWAAVKETLRMIIAGNQVDYVIVDPVFSADDVFFMQLTLPVASFDALKNNYRPNANNAAPVAGEASLGGTDLNAPVAPNPAESMVPPMPSAPVMPTAGDVSQPVSPEVPVAPVAPATPNVAESVQPTSPVAPVMPSAPVQQNVASVMPEPMPQEPVTPVVPTPEPVPSVEPIPEPAIENSQTPVDFTADKEAFLKACENMFDALVAKFKN